MSQKDDDKRKADYADGFLGNPVNTFAGLQGVNARKRLELLLERPPPPPPPPPPPIRFDFPQSEPRRPVVLEEPPQPSGGGGFITALVVVFLVAGLASKDKAEPSGVSGTPHQAAAPDDLFHPNGERKAAVIAAAPAVAVLDSVNVVESILAPGEPLELRAQWQSPGGIPDEVIVRGVLSSTRDSAFPPVAIGEHIVSGNDALFIWFASRLPSGTYQLVSRWTLPGQAPLRKVVRFTVVDPHAEAVSPGARLRMSAPIAPAPVEHSSLYIGG